MHPSVTGLHHVTAIASDPQANVAFYTGLLGLRLVKKTVNFDDPSAYHLYYGDATGSPGTIVTFFTWPEGVARGRVGAGQATRLAFSAAPGALDFWAGRLAARGVAATRTTRFGEPALEFSDPDGIPLAIVAVAGDDREGWTGAGIDAAHALRGMHAIELTVRDARATEAVLVATLGHRLERREGAQARYSAGAGVSGTFVDLVESPAAPTAVGGVGTIHHVAWRVPADDSQRLLHEALAGAGRAVSPVRDRTYFRSIYTREPGGVLVEVATDVPGFSIDEPIATLGNDLKLPPQYEPARDLIEARLPALHPLPQYT